jgi:hypothetical protein
VAAFYRLIVQEEPSEAANTIRYLVSSGLQDEEALEELPQHSSSGAKARGSG